MTDHNTNGTATFADAYGGIVIALRWIVAPLSLAVAFFFMTGAVNLKPFDDYRIFFGPDNPRLSEFQRVEQTYTKTDNVFFTVAPGDGEVFDRETLTAVEALTAEAWKIPFALRVDSITNFQHTSANGDDLTVRDLVRGASDLTDVEVTFVRNAALNEPFLRDNLISSDGSTTGVAITLQFRGESADEQFQTMAAAEELERRIEAEHDVELHLIGFVPLTNEFNVSAIGDLSSLVPIMYLLIIVVAGFLLRSTVAVIGTLFVMLFSMAAAMGFGGLFGYVITPVSSVVPTIVAMLAVADCVHFIVSAQAAQRRGLERRAAVRESMHLNFLPILITSVTTAIGFLSMNFADAPAFHHLGNMAAFGVMMAFFLSVTFLPAWLAIIPFAKGVGGNSIENALARFANFVIARKGSILILSLAASAIIVSAVPRNVLSDDFVKYFQPETKFRTAVDYTNENLTGVYAIQYSLNSGVSGGVSDPDFLQEVEDFAAFMRGQENVRHVNVITDTFKRLNQNLHGDDPSWYRLPEDRELAAQYLLLYELSLPYGLDINNQINVDKSSTQMIVTLSDVAGPEIKRLTELGEGWLAQNTRMDDAKGVGPAVMFAYITDTNIRGMVNGTTVALVMISVLLILALRSLKIGTISLVPNLLPPALAFGVWGLTVSQINVGVSLVTGLVIGIIVDDTVHFLSKYLKARREQGLNAEDAVRYAFRTVGVAILTTSFVLIAGFALLTQSTFGMNELMAKLTMIAIAMAVVADFLLLPALLIFLDGRQKSAAIGQPIPAE